MDGRAQDRTDSQPHVAPTLIARVNGYAIYDHHVRNLLRQTGEVSSDDRQFASRWQHGLKTLIDQQLVYTYLEQHGYAPSKADIQLVKERMDRRLRARQSSLDAYLKQLGSTQDDLDRQLSWQTAWRKYLDETLTDQNLERYFAAHRRDFDGTRLRVAHIFFPYDDAATAAEERQAVREKARQVRQQIVEGQLSFDQAARQFSRSPTADQGGELGWIDRQGPMPEDFTAAAFRLQAGDISPPVASEAGVHLIRCLEIEEGKKTWQDERAQLRQKATHYLFRRLAERERAEAHVEVLYQQPPARAVRGSTSGAMRGSRDPARAVRGSTSGAVRGSPDPALVNRDAACIMPGHERGPLDGYQDGLAARHVRGSSVLGPDPDAVPGSV